MKKRGKIGEENFGLNRFFNITSVLISFTFITLFVFGFNIYKDFNVQEFDVQKHSVSVISFSSHGVCGNQIVEDPEECDDGGDSASCDSDCTFAVCGDGTSNPAAGEQCDDGNDIDYDGCTQCKLDMCNDPGYLNCDGNPSNGCEVDSNNDPTNCGDCGQSCDIDQECIGGSCQSTSECGNNILEDPEECDDGNVNNGDGCSDACLIEGGPVCGNQIVEDPELCDDNSRSCSIDGYSGNQHCNPQCDGWLTCQTNKFCGDNIVNGNEQCDGNSRSCVIGGYSGNQQCNNFCDGWQQCLTSEFCGDGVINGNEQCDDSNTGDGDGCSNLCVNEIGDCGNNICEVGEDSSCPSDCDKKSICGNDILESGEVCDGDSRGCKIGDYQGVQKCSSDCEGWSYCSRIEFCGDSSINGKEVCDGNSRSCVIGGDKGLQQCNINCDGWDKCAIDLSCGNNICDSGESCSTCRTDCGACLEDSTKSTQATSNQKETTSSASDIEISTRETPNGIQFTTFTNFVNDNSLFAFIGLGVLLFLTFLYFATKNHYAK